MSEPTRKVGRPALSKKEKRYKFVTTRISQDEFKEIDQAAKAAGMMRGKWIRTKLLAAARRA
jgi:predicted DNA binding CopG/RHH family protein